MIVCDYTYMVMPMSTIALEILPDGHAGPAARITVQGQSHLESFMEVNAASDELIHGWVSKDTENEVELVVYRQARPEGRSKITTHKMPFGKDIWGKCTIPGEGV
jgi:hypothetical protein